MPRDFAEDVQAKIGNDAFENSTKAIKIGKGRLVATTCVNEPFGS